MFQSHDLGVAKKDVPPATKALNGAAAAAVYSDEGSTDPLLVLPADTTVVVAAEAVEAKRLSWC